MKKLMVIVTMLLLVAFVLSAGGEQEQPVTAEEVTLSVWTAPFARTDAEEQFYKDLTDKFYAEKGIKLEITVVPWGDVYTKYQTNAAAGALGDILWMPPDWGVRLAHGGHLEPVTDVIDSLGGPEAFFSPQWHYYNKQYYGVPGVRNPRICYYRKDLLDEVGYGHSPKDWDQLEDVARKLTGTDRWGTAFYYGTSHYYADIAMMCFMKQSGGGIISKDKEVIFDSPENRRAYKFYTDLYLNGYNPPDAVAWSQSQDALDFLKAGKAGITVLGTSSAIALKSQLPPEQFSNFGFAPLWEGPSGMGSFGANDGWSISAYSDHKEEAKEFIKFFNSEDILVEWLKLTTMLPPMKKMIDNQELQDYFKEIGFWEAGITMLPHGVRYAFPYYGATLADAEIEGAHIVAQVITEIVTGTSTLEEAVAKAQKIIEEIHAKF